MKPQTLKELKKIMRKSSTDKLSGVYGMFENSSKWGEFQFCDNPNIWLLKGEMNVLKTGNPESIIEKANKFLNPLGWNMVETDTQRIVRIEKLLNK